MWSTQRTGGDVGEGVDVNERDLKEYDAGEKEDFIT